MGIIFVHAQVYVQGRGRCSGVDVDGGCQDTKSISHLDGLIPQPMLWAYLPDTGTVSTQPNFRHECISGMGQIHQHFCTDVCVLLENVCCNGWVWFWSSFFQSGKLSMFSLHKDGFLFKNTSQWTRCLCDTRCIVFKRRRSLRSGSVAFTQLTLITRILGSPSFLSQTNLSCCLDTSCTKPTLEHFSPCPPY